jgi:hypothetical protein
MYELIPNIYNNDVTFNQTRYNTTITDNNEKSNTYGQHIVSSTSGSDSLSNLFDNNEITEWTSSGEYKSKSDDPLTSITNGDSRSDTCGGDNYKMGSCIHNYKGNNSGYTIIKYIDASGHGVSLNSKFPGEFIQIKFPKEYYIYESFIGFNHNRRYKPKAYFLLGYSPKHKRWEMIGRNININYAKTEDRLIINKPNRYNAVILSITAGREEPSIKLTKFQLYGSNDLRDHPIKRYIGIKQYEPFSNQIHKKKVSFDNTPEIKYIEPEIKYIEPRINYIVEPQVIYIPTILIFSIFSIFALAIVNKNKK